MSPVSRTEPDHPAYAVLTVEKHVLCQPDRVVVRSSNANCQKGVIGRDAEADSMQFLM